jgi:outer membrane protein assembly factor BamE (lipoprotein component of BamABCDE complex)
MNCYKDSHIQVICFFYIFLLIALNACVSKLDKRGYMFDMSDHNLLQEGITSKERVLKIMGSPTLISDLDSDEAWIYYAEDLKRLLFFKPDIISRDVLVVRFNEAGTIRELNRIDLNDEEKQLQFAANFTNVESRKIGFLKSLFSNVGQVKSQ